MPVVRQWCEPAAHNLREAATWRAVWVVPSFNFSSLLKFPKIDFLCTGTAHVLAVDAEKAVLDYTTERARNLKDAGDQVNLSLSPLERSSPRPLASQFFWLEYL